MEGTATGKKAGNNKEGLAHRIHFTPACKTFRAGEGLQPEGDFTGSAASLSHSPTKPPPSFDSPAIEII